MMRGGQDPCKDIICDRFLQKIAADISPFKDHAVDCRPLIVRKPSSVGASNALTRTHEGSFTRHAPEQPV
jgi:hypothetical protein